MMSQKKQPVTQAEIARRVGISQAAVSTVLSRSSSANVNDETRLQVLAVAEELGYRIRKRKALGSGGSMRNVLFVQNSYITPTDEPWMSDAMEVLYAKMTGVCAEHLAEANIRMTLLKEDASRVIRWLKESDISGVVWHISDSDSAPMQWVASHYPLVLINRVWDSPASYDVVSLNQERALSVAAEHLWERGHRRIAMFGHSDHASFYRRRVAAYLTFVQQHQIRDYKEFRDISDSPDIPALDKIDAILKLWRDLGDDAPTAMILPDIFALPLVKCAPQYGVRIPEDLSVVGMDNALPCQFVQPALSSVDSHHEEIAAAAADMLIQRMNNPERLSRNMQISPKLVMRDSVKILDVGGAGTGSVMTQPLPQNPNNP